MRADLRVVQQSVAPSITQWRQLLGQALEGHGLRIVFQPVVDVRQGRVAGYEAFVRFDLVDGLGPRDWFDAAGALGVAEDLDAMVLQRVLRARSDLPSHVFLAVNIEPESLLNPRIRGLLAAQGTLHGIVIDVTGHRPIGAFDEIRPVFDELTRAGARLALDDAGSGYEGIRQILALRPAYMKLDRSTIADIDTDEARRAMTEMLGVIAARAGASLWAEGVETVGEATTIAELFVPLAQGYAFGRPTDCYSSVDPSLLDLVRNVLGTPVASTDEEREPALV